MTAKTNAAEQGALTRLKSAGSALANCAFNLAQKKGEPLTERECASLDACRREWDDARSELFAAALQPAAPAEDVYPVVRITVADDGSVADASLYAPGLPAGVFNVYPVGIENVATGQPAAPAEGASPKPTHNPWRTPLENCISGDNYLRASEYRDLVDELDELYARREAEGATPSGPASGDGRDEFLMGVCVALAHVYAHGQETLWGEIVQAVGVDDLLQYATFVEPDEWALAGFDRMAMSELRRGKPRVRRVATPAPSEQAQAPDMRALCERKGRAPL